MSAKKSPKPNTGPWLSCSSCPCLITSKEMETHTNDCPPNTHNLTHSYIRNEILYSKADVKTNEEIKAATLQEKNSMVFLSESVIRLCNLSIGDWALITPMENGIPFTCLVWPTVEKSNTSVLFTKFCLDTLNLNGKAVAVSKVPFGVCGACKVDIVLVNAPKHIEVSADLVNRISKLYLNRIFCEGSKICFPYFGIKLTGVIKNIEAESKGDLNLDESLQELSLTGHNLLKTNSKTIWNVFKNTEDYTKKSKPISSTIGGLDKEIEEIKSLMELAFDSKNQQSNVCRSILLYGASGTGKTLITKTLSASTPAKTTEINHSDIYTKSTPPEETIRSLFEESLQSPPTLIIIDEIELLCPVRSSRLTDTEKRITSTMLKMFDSIHKDKAKAFVVAVTNKPDAIDPAFRRCDRLDREIEIPIPNSGARLEILRKLQKDVDIACLQEVAAKTHGFVGADLKSLCSCATLNCFRMNRRHLSLSMEDFEYALRKVSPSAMRAVQIELPNVKWSDIGGQDHLKLILRQCVEWPLSHADSFLRMGITPPKGVLMFGPPGCSKTMIAKALATESGLNFLSIKGPELFSKWVGESERAVRELFRRARQVAPSVIFFDEIDALGGERSAGGVGGVQERVLAQLLTEMDGVTPLGDVVVLAATNRPDRIDKALLRPGRLDRIVYVPLPDEKTREEIFRIKFRKMPVDDIDIDALVGKTEGYSGAEINAVCHEAAMKALEEDLNIQKIRSDHFDSALKIITPRITEESIKIYEDYVKNTK